MDGRLIVIEGNDSSGKKTQADLLIRKLESRGIKTEMADFPQYYSSFYGRLVARYLRGEFGQIDDISPYLSSLLYAGDRLEAKDKLDKWLAEGKTVICNRYAESSMAYGAAKFSDQKEQERYLAWLDKLEYCIHKIPRPDMIFYLHVPISITRELIKHKEKREYLEGKRKDIHEKDKDYLKRVEVAYLMLCRKQGWIKIECSEDSSILPPEKISEILWSELDKFISSSYKNRS